MALRVSPRARIAAIAAVLVASALAVPAVSHRAAASPHPPASPGAAAGAVLGTPNLGSRINGLQQRLQVLVRRNAELVEQYNQATTNYGNLLRAARGADARYRTALRASQSADESFRTAAAARYEGGTFSATGALLDSSSGANYLDQLQTLAVLSQHSAQLASQVSATQRQAQRAKRAADAALAAATAAKNHVVRARAQTKAEIAKYRTLLSSLTAKQRAIWAAQATSRISIVHRAAALRIPAAMGLRMSPRVREAVMFALSQVGKPYVWGTAGPSTYDCSGLTMQAYAAAGVSLPHSAYDQYDYGHHVSFGELKPGDLMFFYDPIAHVTMYIGDGLMVSAPTSGEVVQVISADSYSSDFVGATRLIG